jgi:hypothetical protein
MRNPIAVSPKRIIVTAMITGISLAAAACGSAAAPSGQAVQAGGGHRVVVKIHASLHGRKGVCETSFRAHQPPPPPPPMMVPAPAPTMAAPTPMQPMM